jgi:hypothetical protein
MRNLLAFLAAAVLTFLGLGWYLDWYRISSVPEAGGHRKVEIDLNTPKISADVEKGEEKVRKMLEKNSKKDAAASPEARKGAANSPEVIKKEAVPPAPGNNPSANQAEPKAEGPLLPPNNP